MANNTIGREIYKGTIWSITDNFTRQVITFIVFIVLARILNPEIFGLLAVSLLLIQIFRTVTFDSIATAIIRKAELTDDDLNTGFWYCVGLSIPAFIILYFLSPVFEQWSGAKGMAGVIRGTSFILLTSGLSRMHQVWHTHRMNFRVLAIRSFISVVLGGVIGIMLAKRGYGIESVVAQQLTTSFSELLLLWLITPWRPKFSASKRIFFEMTHFGKHVALTGITNFINQNSDAFFVTYYLGAIATGIYTTGKRITNTLNVIISTSLLRVSLPAFARLQNNDEELRKIYLGSTTLTAMVTAPLFIGLAVLSKDITLLLLGEKWMEAVPVMQIVTVIGFLTSIGYYNQSIMLAKNKPQWQTRLTLLYAVTNIIAFIIFTRYGLIYTALAFSLRAFLLYPVSAWCALKLINLSWRKYVKVLLPALVSSALMAVVIIIVMKLTSIDRVAVRLTFLVASGILSYALFIFFFMPAVYKEKMIKHAVKIIQKKKEIYS
jgi:O-antigen/teichoic acid export membrane protein